MHRFKSTLPNILVFALCILGSTSACAEYEPNDNYSSFVLSFQSSKFSTPVCISGECHELITGPAIVYAKQLIPNLALGMSGSQLQSAGRSSSIKETDVSAFLQAIAGMGPRFDIGASVAALNTSTDLCSQITNSCVNASDNGANIGVFGKVFLNENKSVNVTLGYNTVSFQKSSNQNIIGLTLVTILAKHHRVSVSTSRVRDSNGNDLSGGFGLSYSYLLYY